MTEQQAKAYSYFLNQGFLPIDTEQYLFLRSFDGDNHTHEMTAAVCSIWGFAYHALYKHMCSCLCSIWFYSDGHSSFLVHRSPEMSKEGIEALVDNLYELSEKSGLSGLQIWPVEERFLEDYKQLETYVVHAECDGNWCEYIYSPKNILELSGRANSNKRNRVKKFFAMPDISIRPLTKDNFDHCLQVEEAWCREQDCAYCESFGGCAKKSLENMAALFEERFFQGMIGYINDIPVGYVIWENIGRWTFVYFAKTYIPNFNMYLYYMMAKNYLFAVEFINIGSDMGKIGLRVFKQHLSAHEILRKYHCTFEKRQIR
jgi:hypothetical protein